MFKDPVTLFLSGILILLLGLALYASVDIDRSIRKDSKECSERNGQPFVDKRNNVICLNKDQLK